MRHVTGKLSSRRGASLLLALLLLLLASMVSVVILSAATTAARRLNDDRGREQDYLALSSAARLVEEGVSSATVTLTETRETLDEDFAGYSIQVTGSVGFLAPLLRNGVEDLLGRLGPSHYDEEREFLGRILSDPNDTRNLTLTALSFEETLQVRPQDDALKTVEGSFQMRLIPEDATSAAATFPIRAQLRLDGGAQRLYLSAYVPNVSVSISTESWEETGEGEEEDAHYYTRTTAVTTLTWTADLSTNPPRTEVAP